MGGLKVDWAVTRIATCLPFAGVRPVRERYAIYRFSLANGPVVPSRKNC